VEQLSLFGALGLSTPQHKDLGAKPL